MCVAPIPLKQETSKWKSRKAFHIAKSDVINVPCGRCVECRKTYINGWVFRLTNELKSSNTLTASFLTLTYDDNALYNPDNHLVTPDGEFTLNYKHHQDWIKRLRKSYGNTKSNIKYFSVGEYGDKSDRPHFHSIIFNADQQNVLDTWGHGNVHFGEVTESSIAYTLKYAYKKIGRVHKKDYQDENVTRAVERSLISQGLGKEYAESKQVKKFYQDDLTKNAKLNGGQIQPLPRYYREKIYTPAQLEARSRIVQKQMDHKTPEELREAQALARRSYQKISEKIKGRQNTGY